MANKIYGAYDKKVEEKDLKEFPLKEGWDRIYTDHTGRWFEDVDPGAPIDPSQQELFDIMSQEINKEIIKEIYEKSSSDRN